MSSQEIRKNSIAKKKCFKCQRLIIRKYILSKKAYSLKNDWYYWTENEDYRGKYVCDKCLLTLYYNDKGKYLNEVSNKKKRRVFTAYVYDKTIFTS